MIETTDEIVLKLENMPISELEHFFAVRNKKQKNDLAEIWAPHISFTKLSCLDADGLAALITTQIVGNVNKGIQPLRKVFYVQPSEKLIKLNQEREAKGQKPIYPYIGRGIKKGVRQMDLIKEPTRLDGKDGCYCARKYGVGSKDPNTNGWLTEVTDAEFIAMEQKRSLEKAKKAEAARKKKAAEKEAERQALIEEAKKQILEEMRLHEEEKERQRKEEERKEKDRKQREESRQKDKEASQPKRNDPPKAEDKPKKGK